MAYSIGAVWFGAHVGGGFATGNQGWAYFASFGLIGIFMPILIMALVGWNNRELLRGARNSGATNYRDWALNAFAPYGKPMAVVIEIETIILYLLASSGAIAGCASLLSSYGIPYIVGVLLTGGVLLCLSVFGTSVYRKSSSVMSIVLIAALLIVLLYGIISGASNLAVNVAAVDASSTASLGATIWAGLKYGGFQAFSGISSIPIAVQISNEKELNAGIGIGFIMNAVMTSLVSIFLLCWAPIAGGQTLPILTVLQTNNQSFLVILYSISLALAFITTALGAVFGMVARLEPALKKWEVKPIVKRVVISLGFMVIAMGISLAGLDNIVKIGYGYVGVAAIFTIILPAVTLLFVRNNRKAKELAAQEKENA